MNSYEATFSITAEVIVKVTVTGENQQEGLVAAHDAIRLVKPDQAHIVSLNLDSAQNIDFQRLAQAVAPAMAGDNPPSPLSIGTSFKVKLYTRPKCEGVASLETDVGGFEAAKSLAESVLLQTSQNASAQVFDQFGFKVLEVQAERGDWEVEAISTTPGEKNRRFSWLSSQEEAKRTAVQLLRQKGTAYVRITDFTDRKKGPVLWKEIR